ncbi:uncharacterized protein HMPREF1541_08564 [Cyphellophora europaea CBS 101466]|uniref:Uncharacterized protein n=1 Tax=Cyphellophora europaea (strain CBS 101466) TaxID=1220924 RepID=W2RIF1_CYPE1|nr:uncharacterized protein HMPREF1541_08564 [Cyphellophora europaea CBS 101466]ETN36287.1 hypothetical protein HMPREF1541_08564 [Cyphellophora europaea CBS 101466]
MSSPNTSPGYDWMALLGRDAPNAIHDRCTTELPPPNSDASTLSIAYVAEGGVQYQMRSAEYVASRVSDTIVSRTNQAADYQMQAFDAGVSGFERLYNQQKHIVETQESQVKLQQKVIEDQQTQAAALRSSVESILPQLKELQAGPPSKKRRHSETSQADSDSDDAGGTSRKSLKTKLSRKVELMGQLRRIEDKVESNLAERQTMDVRLDNLSAALVQVENVTGLSDHYVRESMAGIKRALADNKHAENEHATISAALDTLNTQYQALNETTEGVNGKYKGLVNGMTVMAQHMDEISGTSQATTNNTFAMRSDLVIIKSKLSSLDNSATEVNQALITLDKKVDDVNDSVTGVQEDLADVQQDVKDCGGGQDALSDDMTSMRGEVREIKAMLTALMAAVRPGACRSVGHAGPRKLEVHVTISLEGEMPGAKQDSFVAAMAVNVEECASLRELDERMTTELYPRIVRAFGLVEEEQEESKEAEDDSVCFYHYFEFHGDADVAAKGEGGDGMDLLELADEDDFTRWRASMLVYGDRVLKLGCRGALTADADKAEEWRDVGRKVSSMDMRVSPKRFFTN